MPSFVSDFTGILGMRSWAAEVPNSPTVLTYSFLEEPQINTFQDQAAGFQPFTVTPQHTARSALEKWASASGLMRIEVGAGEGDLSFGNDELPDGVSGMTIEPFRVAI
jgi:hypothetical protein